MFLIKVEYKSNSIKIDLMLQVKNSILYFLVLVLGILLDLDPDASQKQGRFFKTLSENVLKFVSFRTNSTIVFNFRFVLLPAEVDLVLEKQSLKENALVVRGSGYFAVVLTLLTKIITLYMQAFIIKFGVSGLEEANV